MGIVDGGAREIRSSLQLIVQRFNLFQRFILISRSAVLLVPARNDNDLRQMVFRLSQIEFGLVGLIEFSDVRVRNVDLGFDLVIHHLFHAEVDSSITSNFIQRQPMSFQPLIELLIRVARSLLRDSRVHLVGTRHQVQPLRALKNCLFDDSLL